MTAQEYRWMFLLYGVVHFLQILEFLIWKGGKSHNSYFSLFIALDYVFTP